MKITDQYRSDNTLLPMVNKVVGLRYLSNAIWLRAHKVGCRSLKPIRRKDNGFTAGFEDPFGNYWFIVEGES